MLLRVKDFFDSKGVSVLRGKNPQIRNYASYNYPIKGTQKRMNTEDPQKFFDYYFYKYLNFTVCAYLGVSI